MTYSDPTDHQRRNRKSLEQRLSYTQSSHTAPTKHRNVSVAPPSEPPVHPMSGITPVLSKVPLGPAGRHLGVCRGGGGGWCLQNDTFGSDDGRRMFGAPTDQPLDTYWAHPLTPYTSIFSLPLTATHRRAEMLVSVCLWRLKYCCTVSHSTRFWQLQCRHGTLSSIQQLWIKLLSWKKN